MQEKVRKSCLFVNRDSKTARIRQIRQTKQTHAKLVKSAVTAPVRGRSHRVSVVYLCNNTSGREQGG
jgi:hypothetical protein